MKIGDLVRGGLGGMGIILWQVGVTDRWMVAWADGKRYAVNGYNLFSITDKKCP